MEKVHKKGFVFMKKQTLFYAKSRIRTKYIRCIYKKSRIIYNLGMKHKTSDV